MRNTLRMLFSVALALCCHAVAAAPFVLDGRVIGIQDGDTLTLLDAGRNQHRIRLDSIDAPEIDHGSKKPGQPYGQRSKQSLSDIAYGRDVRADCETKDRRGRKVCTVWIASLNANLELVRLGMAMVYRKYTRDQAYFAAETEAREARRGLWADTGPVEPWVWRKQHAVE